MIVMSNKIRTLFVIQIAILIIMPTGAAIFNRYSPIISSNAETINAVRTIPIKIELLASRKANAKMKNIARQAIIDNYSGQWANTGIEANRIGKIMERNFYGYWMVGIFDANFDVAYTIIRRSPAYLLYAINDWMILIAKEGNGQPVRDGEII